MSPEKEYLSLEEVADLLGVNYQLIYKLVRSGEMPAMRIGKVYRIQRGDLNAYLETTKGATGRAACSACGKSFVSRLSLKEECVECGDLICVDCWERKKIRHCREHQPLTVSKEKIKK